MHHAILLIGNREWGYSQIEAPHEEIVYREYDRMSINDARVLKNEVLFKPLETACRVFVITTASILPEAQNALLKLFEEPNHHTRFYIIVPREDMLIPTLRSRLQFLRKEEQGDATDSFNNFLKLGYGERLLLVADKLKVEDNAWVEEILEGAEHYAKKAKASGIVRDAVLTTSFIRTTGSSRKMLLEHLALSF